MSKVDTLLTELEKRKISLSDLYLLCLRQILLNQKAIMTENGVLNFRKGNDSQRLANRVMSFIENKE